MSGPLSPQLQAMLQYMGVPTSAAPPDQAASDSAMSAPPSSLAFPPDPAPGPMSGMLGATSSAQAMAKAAQQYQQTMASLGSANLPPSSQAGLPTGMMGLPVTPSAPSLAQMQQMAKFALSGARPSPLPPDTPTASYQPNATYAMKNLAPETYPMASLDALAQAQAAATKAGVLSPGLAKYFLANQLVENRPKDFAMNSVPTVTPGQADPYAGWVDKMGLPPGYAEPHVGGITYKYGGDAPLTASLAAPTAPPELVDQAKYAAMFLAAKPGPTPEAQIRAWNGSGSGADNHLAKVQAMASALQTMPGNKSLMQTYQRMVSRYSNPQMASQ